MVKKIVCMAVMVIMASSFLACENLPNGQDTGLADYKIAAKAALDVYAQDKGANNYSEENWVVIGELVATGKAAIEAAENKPAVDAAYNDAKTAIDAVIPEELSEELESRIKADYLKEFGHEFCFDKFYGLYNGAAVFFIQGVTDAVKVVTISGLVFSYHTGWTILVWKDGVFYNLENIETIFDAGVLTQADLIKMAAIHANDREVEMNEVDFVIGYENMNTSFSKNSFLEQIVNSLEEWILIYNQNCPNELIEKYNEHFFADNSLIVYAFMKGTSGNQIEITKISKNGNELSVEADVRLGIMDAVSQGIIIIEVAKADIAGVNTVHIIEN